MSPKLYEALSYCWSSLNINNCLDEETKKTIKKKMVSQHRHLYESFQVNFIFYGLIAADSLKNVIKTLQKF